MTAPAPFGTLRNLLGRRPPAAESCDLCGSTLPERHEHLVEPASAKLACSCRACALLFPVRKGTRFKRVPTRVERLPDGDASNLLFSSLGAPVNLAFFVHRSDPDRVLAFYPSPAGPTPAPVDPEAWKIALERCPALQGLEPDIEALLLHGLGGAREAFIVPIDLCYQLVGELRLRWKGLSGGVLVHQKIEGFFRTLRERAGRQGGGIDHD